MGANQLVLGTDHPYGSWRRPIELLQEIDCTESEREQILHGNAERLFLP
jgi:predicted TIM-barrel fold metal-dependent hydrolase